MDPAFKLLPSPTDVRTSKQGKNYISFSFFKEVLAGTKYSSELRHSQHKAGGVLEIFRLFHR